MRPSRKHELPLREGLRRHTISAMLHEPAVALTDLSMAIECAVFCVLLQRRAPMSPLRRALLWMMGATSASALAGAVVHAFLPDPTTQAFAVVWRLTLSLIGIAAIAAFLTGAYMIFPAKRIPLLRWCALASFAAYQAIVLWVSVNFAVAVAYYLPAAVFLMFAFWSKRKTREGARRGAFGMLLMLVAASIQQLGIGIHPVYFDHNALYHTVEMVALLLLFLGFEAGESPRAFAVASPSAS